MSHEQDLQTKNAVVDDWFGAARKVKKTIEPAQKNHLCFNFRVRGGRIAGEWSYALSLIDFF